MEKVKRAVQTLVELVRPYIPARYAAAFSAIVVIITYLI